MAHIDLFFYIFTVNFFFKQSENTLQQIIIVIFDKVHVENDESPKVLQ